VPSTGLVARLGGDEFGIVLADVPNAQQARHAADSLMRAFHDPVVLDDLPVRVGASLGVSLAPEHGCDASALLKHADAAMYAAKASGKDRHEIYETRMPTRTWTELEAAG
jgi:diguanylate cyclase (GGDEF)-like protein